VNDKGASVGDGRVVSLSEPNFKMSQGTVPSKYLYDNRKNKSCDMEDFYRLVFFPYTCTKEQKNNPEKMDEDCEICSNFIKHR